MLQSLMTRLRGANDDDQGFTLIELLVVVLIIGILAAIALPTFLGQQDKAKDASAKSDVRNAITQVESCLADGSTVATCAASSNPDLAQFKRTVPAAGGSVTPTGGSAVTVDYSITSTSAAGGTHTYTIGKKSGGGFVYSTGAAATGSAAWVANNNT